MIFINSPPKKIKENLFEFVPGFIFTLGDKTRGSFPYLIIHNVRYKYLLFFHEKEGDRIN